MGIDLLAQRILRLHTDFHILRQLTHYIAFDFMWVLARGLHKYHHKHETKRVWVMLEFKEMLCAMLVTLSLGANAEFVDTDWKTSGDKLAMLDTETGIEWLDLLQTAGETMNTIRPKLDVGGAYEGWRFATASEVETMAENFFNIEVEPGVEYYEDPEPSPEPWQTAYHYVRRHGATQHENHGDYTRGVYEGETGISYRMDVRTSGRVRVNLQGYSYGSTTGVFLVSDGGTTVSSINDPSINANNANSPYSQTANLSSVSPMAGFGVLMIMVGGVLRRRSGTPVPSV
jgi:hypothetical protein